MGVRFRPSPGGPDSAAVDITGNLTADPELHFTLSGKPVAGFSVAVNSRRKDGDQWVDGETTYYPVAVRGEQAEHIKPFSPWGPPADA